MQSVGLVLYERDTETRWIDDPVHGLILQTMAGLNDTAAQLRGPSLTDQQLRILRAIALSAASMSMTSGILVGWWFARMKRSFRHHLIMLMIFSDFFKASWQLIYPAVVFSSGGNITSESRFCQTAGFMMSMGIEASDFAVLAIAVHSALYIFRPGMGAIGEGGLFRYRYYVYATWLAFSIVMPSLAFLNKEPAYTAQGTFCYLPVRPFWYRLALAWIPRYLILLTIMTLYAAIYIYVRMRFRTFRTSVGASTLDVDTIDLAPPEHPSQETQRLPSIDSHGLIPPSPCPLTASRQPSDSGQPFARALLAPPNDRANMSSSSDGSQDCSSRRGSAVFPSGAPSTTDADRTSQDKRRQIKEETANEEARRRRIAISRQLRLLFIYPLVYALMWLPPLFSHALQFTDRFVMKPSFPLHCVVAFTLPFQCFVDCWLFTIREKPWRYIPESSRGNWFRRYGFGLSKYKGKSTEIGAEEGGDEGWRRRKHLSFEARKAYERRDAETKDAAKEWFGREESIRTRKPERSWWDVEDQQIEEDFEEEEDDDRVSAVSDEDESNELEGLTTQLTPPPNTTNEGRRSE
ncbi:G protein-coupled glucose receptor regulating Gpa2-domain-containing protein [Pyronema domesticum]|uniref:Similar to G protein-coupled receptor GPR1 acc. no. Q12361 n=1 Tax=Pyronema omphalodes (strain CBS 100304) TaxID=1076935 RepID=U4LB11_PYROM|nr:G protein-coupled glucose receptor regulating Gpa2-domain-containing protein [Pyronema domesticum]CCX07349.1 Similar to G protein-coupled receptor GPR1; acc. no. Q12361 [Pyronema omphalodes CBS 100304]